jgi:hypothetical protein
MQQELAILRQAILVAPSGAAQGAGGGGVPGGVVPTGAAPGGGVRCPFPSVVSLMQWMSMKLDTFAGSGTPAEVADWLTYVEDKMDVFEIVFGDRVHFGTKLLKGEAGVPNLVERRAGSSLLFTGSLDLGCFYYAV